jgi:Uma2 family endonuclease
LEHRLGEVFEGETGFLLAREPDTVRAPDIAFVAAERIATAERQKGFWVGAPDLAVEVVSPGDTQREIDEKVMAWLDAGARLVWVVNPTWRTVTIYRSRRKIRVLTEDDELSGEDVVPGFRCPVGAVFVGV